MHKKIENECVSDQNECRKQEIFDCGFPNGIFVIENEFSVNGKIDRGADNSRYHVCGGDGQLECDENAENCIIYKETNKRRCGEFKDLFVYAE